MRSRARKMLTPFHRAKVRVVKARRRMLSIILPYRPMRGSRESLDAEYAQGIWDYLGGLNEAARLSVVAGYCHYLRGHASILEIGCGEGQLQERLDPSRYSRYVGVDISAEAIRRAMPKQDEKTIFVREDASVYEPEGEFDFIVFNECLEYFPDPLGIVRRFDRFLKPDGWYIVSMFDSTETARTRRIWKRLETSYRAEIATRVTNRSDYAWIIKVFAHPGRGDQGRQEHNGGIPTPADGGQTNDVR